MLHNIWEWWNVLKIKICNSFNRYSFANEYNLSVSYNRVYRYAKYKLCFINHNLFDICIYDYKYVVISISL